MSSSSSTGFIVLHPQMVRIPIHKLVLPWPFRKEESEREDLPAFERNGHLREK
jgi:hypothetical protein